MLVLIMVLLRRNVSMAVVMPVGAAVLGMVCLPPPLDFLTATVVAIMLQNPLKWP
ncbi:MAG: hypothetical protein PHH28_10665 [Desulfuromonadaceae bacterium]|nr:hypothetical protein [Desulfuromonadaceae bacterium]